MGISIDRNLRQPLIFYSIIIMLAGLFASRVLLSAGMVFFLGLTCFHKNFLKQLHVFLHCKTLAGMALLFFIPFVSELWSTDKNEWLNFVRVKLPLLFFPVAFAGNWQLTKRQWRQLAYIFLGLVLAGSLWSLWQYVQNVQAIHAAYLRAKTLPTPLQNDHVRFSWMVCIGIILAVFLLEQTKILRVRITLVILSVFLAAYLHILSARTGLFCLYIFAGLYIIRWLILEKKRWPALALLVIILLTPLMAWLFSPTFQNRIRYLVYDFSFVKKQEYLQGSNDGNRILSLKAGWSILQENPLGVGAGDVIHETTKWYAAHVPGMIERDKIYPSSEWLIYGDTAGWPGFVLFTIIMLLPLFEKKSTQKFYWISLNILAAFSFMFDVGLEVQFGVFLYAFIVLCCWKQWIKDRVLL